MAQTKIHRKKKKTKVDPDGIAFVKSTFNNTIISLTDKYGNAISWSSSGSLGFRGSRKSTPFAAAQAADLQRPKLKDVRGSNGNRRPSNDYGEASAQSGEAPTLSQDNGGHTGPVHHAVGGHTCRGKFGSTDVYKAACG